MKSNNRDYSMNIGFDFDKVFINYPPFMPDKLINRIYKKRDNGGLLYRMPKKPEQFIRQLSHHHLFRPPISDNISFLRSIPKKGNKLYLISSRFGFLKKRTNYLVKKYGFEEIFDEMFFNFENQQPHVFKNKVLKKISLDLYVDDDFSLVTYLAKRNSTTSFFWLNNKTKFIKLKRNVTAISRLQEIEVLTKPIRQKNNVKSS